MYHGCMADSEWVREHHKQSEVAYNRPGYREARWERAIKVYTVNQESRYLLVQNVHALGVTRDLMELFSLYGDIEEYRLLDEYPSEPYTDVYWIKYVTINSARVAKRKIDNRSFFGKPLHVCYAPEYEGVEETREKLQLRRKVISQKTKGTYEGAQKPLQANESRSQPKTGLSASTGDSGPSPPLQSHDYHVPGLPPLPFQSHDYHVPGLPPLPQLPLPPTETGTAYPSTINVELPSRVSSSAVLMPRGPDLRPHANDTSGLKVRFSHGHGDTHPFKVERESGLFDPSGLSKHKRVKVYLQTEQGDVTGLSRVASSVTTADTASGSHGLKTAGRTHTASDSHELKTAARTTGGIPLKLKTRQPVQPPTTGNQSVNRSVHSIREQMNKVWDPPEVVLKPKKRKRI